jgi:CubicO group peptidase (beta-lactamase class C family)
MKLVRRFNAVSLLTLALLVSGYSTLVARGNDAIANLDAFIAKALHEYQVPGAAVAVVQDGKLTLLKGYGVRDATKPGAVDENTIFQLASVTKTLTGYRLATTGKAARLIFY